MSLKWSCSRCSNYYLYRHHIQDLLSFTAGGKENYLAPQIFIPDSPQDTFTALNPGYVKRRALSASSKIFETSGRIVEPVFNQRRWIPPNIEIKLNLRRSQPEIYLVSSTTTSPCPYKIVFEDVQLRIHRHVINPKIITNHQKLLSSGKRMQLPTRSYDVKTFSVAKGSMNVASEILWSGVLPEMIVFFMQDTERVLGKLNKSIFCLNHFNIQSLVITVNGDSVLWREITFDMSKDINLIGFETIQAAFTHPELGTGITKDDYKNGTFMVVLDLSPDNFGGAFQPQKQGQLQIELKFREALTNTITCFAIAQNQTLIQIDKNNQV